MEQTAVHYFTDDLDVGKVGERAFSQMCDTLLDDAYKLKDVSSVKFYQRLDIDFLLEYTHNDAVTLTTYEIKTAKDGRYDAHTFEIVANLNKNTPGAVYASKAMYMFYYSLDLDRFYCYYRPALAAYCMKHEADYKQCDVLNESGYKTRVLVIPRVDLVNAGILRSIITRDQFGGYHRYSREKDLLYYAKQRKFN